MSKLSFYVQTYPTEHPERPLSAGGVADLVDAGAAVLKVENSPLHAAWANQRRPSLIVVARHIEALERIMDGTPPSKDAARYWYDRARPIIRQAPLAYWEDGYNELGLDQLAAFSDFQVERQRLMAADGFRCCIGNFSAETPLYARWGEFRPALEACLRYGNLLGLHGYNSPTLDAPESIDFLFPHRRLSAALWAGGLPMPRVVYGEFGLDSILSQHKLFDGWRAVPGMTPFKYAAQLEWADAQLAADPDVVGACVFIYSRTESIQPAYNIAFAGRRPEDEPAVADLLLDYLRAGSPASPVIVAPPAAEPPPTPAPAPAPAPVTLLETHFDSYRHTFLPGDTYGDRWTPLMPDGSPMFFYGWKDDPDKISHVEPYPPENSGYAAPSALRLQNQAPRVMFWMGRVFDTAVGDTLRVTVGSGAEIVDASGEVERRIVIDPDGGTDAALKSLPKLSVTDPAQTTLTLDATATGPRTTVMLLTRCTVPARINVDYTLLRVEKLPGIVEVPPTAPPPAPSVPYYATVTEVLNVRIGRADSGPLVGQVRPGDVVKVLDDSGPRAVIDFPVETSVLKDYLTPEGG